LITGNAALTTGAQRLIAGNAALTTGTQRCIAGNAALTTGGQCLITALAKIISPRSPTFFKTLRKHVCIFIFFN